MAESKDWTYWDPPEGHEVTNWQSQSVTHGDAVVKTAEIVADKIVLKVGTLEIVTQSEPGSGCVPFCPTLITLDGKEFPVRAIKLWGDVNGVWQVQAEFYPEA